MKKQDKALLDKIKRLYGELRLKMSKKWNRDLPFEELLFDRWERAKQLGFGAGSSIYHSSYVYGKVKVGKKVWIGPFTLLDGSGGLKIGDVCSISAGVQIYSHDTVEWALSGGRARYLHRPVKIGSHCFIGPYSVIRAGVEIGDRVVVGANSFVNRDLPSGSIAFGTPAKIVGKVKKDRSGRIRFDYFK